MEEEEEYGRPTEAMTKNKGEGSREKRERGGYLVDLPVPSIRRRGQLIDLGGCGARGDELGLAHCNLTDALGSLSMVSIGLGRVRKM